MKPRLPVSAPRQLDITNGDGLLRLLARMGGEEESFTSHTLIYTNKASLNLEM